MIDGNVENLMKVTGNFEKGDDKMISRDPTDSGKLNREERRRRARK